MSTILSALLRVAPHLRRRKPSAGGEAGQATVEYALVLLGVAAIALLVASWATKTNLVGRLLDVVFTNLRNQAK